MLPLFREYFHKGGDDIDEQTSKVSCYDINLFDFKI